MRRPRDGGGERSKICAYSMSGCVRRPRNARARAPATVRKNTSAHAQISTPARSAAPPATRSAAPPTAVLATQARPQPRRPHDDAPARVLAHVEQHHDRLTLLVNNAGSAWRATFADGGWANIHRTMEVNFDAAVRLTERLLPVLRASAPSAIVNVASTAGRVT